MLMHEFKNKDIELIRRDGEVIFVVDKEHRNNEDIFEIIRDKLNSDIRTITSNDQILIKYDQDTLFNQILWNPAVDTYTKEPC